MHLRPFHRHALAVALAAVLASPGVPAAAQQVVADGDEQSPAAGDYATTAPVTPGNPAGYVFHALNGGSIVPAGEVNLSSSGERAAAARVEGAGSRIELVGGSVLTTGHGAAGLSADSGGHVQLVGTRIDTQGTAASGIAVTGGSVAAAGVTLSTYGGGAHGVELRQGTAGLRDSTLNIHGGGSHGIYVENGSVLVENSTINHAGGGAGVWAEARGSGDVTLRNVRINGTGGGAMGVMAGLGSTVVLQDVDIVLSHAQSGAGLTVGGEVQMHGGRIHAGGDNATAVSFASRGGKVLLDGTDVYGHFGILMMEDAELTLRNVSLEGEVNGLNVNQRGGVVDVSGSTITTSRGAAISVANDSQVSIAGSIITAGGNQAQAVAVMGGNTQVANSALQTSGSNGHALYVQGAPGRAPVATVSATDILTGGAGAIGAIARLGGTVHLSDSVVRTTGLNAHGVLSGGTGEMRLANTHVRTEGEGAWAAVINDNGRLDIDGGSLVSAQHGGVWLRSSRDPGLTLANGALLSGGNGIALALDAAVAGRFDVALDGGSQMLGDIVITPEDEDAGLVPQSDVHVRLSNGSLWQGASGLVQTMAIESGSQWTLAGDATVGELQLLNSGLALSDGSGTFNTLTVEGNLHSEAAQFLFNGALAGDGSTVDRLHVRGDATGDASIRVSNVGGVGAPTRDGIALIQIDGASLADYRLAGRAVGGSYEYFLHKGSVSDPGDGNWYLRSELGDPCDLDPTAPGCVVDPGPGPGPDPGDGGEEGGGGGGDPVRPPPVLRPEAGAYLANQSAALNMFAHRMHDRGPLASPDDGRHAWARVGRSTADFSAVDGQLSVDGSTSLLQIGSDVWRTGNATLGVMLGSGRADSSVVSRVTGYSAKGRVRGTAVGAYGTWLQNPGAQEGAYVDATAQYGRFANRLQGAGLEREHYDARVANVSVETGYTVGVSQGRGGNLYVQPQLQLSYAAYAADRHVESNGTRVDRADAGGLSGRAGVRVFGHRDGIAGRLQPYAGVTWLRGSGRSTLEFNGERLGADVPRNRYELQAGAELMLDARWSAWGGISAQRGDHGYRNMGGQVGMRMAW
ncbi:autotransporter family protein [Stenotrophomonas sepilia]